MTEQATFAAGCFWGIEDAFMQTPGVLATQVGYIGGHTPNPTYHQVCSGLTGYAEAVQATYDPNLISYQELLDLFWSIHNPTTLNSQGPDIGTQYRSAIFYHSPEQQALALASREKMQQSGKWKNPIVTEIIPADTFYRAEEYHQQYNQKHSRSCSIQ